MESTRRNTETDDFADVGNVMKGYVDVKNGGITTNILMIKLNKNVKKGVQNLKRAECKWEELLEAAFLLEDIINNRDSHTQTI